MLSVVFDLGANMTYMAPYTNCGSSPRSINASSELNGLSGTCNVQNGVKSPGSGTELKSTGAKKDSAAANLRGNFAGLGAAVSIVACALFYGIL